jgi:hypothetical protein
MSACRSATFVCTAVFSAAVSSRAAAPMIDPAGRGPVLDPGLAKPVTTTLTRAMPVALRRLRERPSCRALFTRLGADGAAEINRASYHPASATQEKKYCRRGTFAMTTVRGSAVKLCRSFAHLSDQGAATILIHEALHLAGQGESPSDPRAPDAVAISGMVMRSCWLF